MSQVRRRHFLIAVGALFAAPVTGIAQKQAKIFRIGYLNVQSPPLSVEAEPQYKAFLDGMRGLGYVEGKNLVIERRFANGNAERLPGLVADLARLKADVIVVGGAAAARAAQQATGTLPIVMIGVGDPVALGLVASLSKPGKNITGVSNQVADVSSKSLEFLRAVVPKLSRVAVLLNPANPLDPMVLRQVQAAAKLAGINVSVFEATTANQIDIAFAAIARSRPEALIVAPDPYYSSQARHMAELAQKSRLPAIYSTSGAVEAGGLMSYGEDLAVNFRRATPYVDKILKGAKPADLPVEQPTKFELVINKKTAKAIGITIPQELLLRADRVIE